MNWTPKKSVGLCNDSDPFIAPHRWAEIKGDGAIIEGIDHGRVLVWLSDGRLPEGRKEPMSFDARALYSLLATYFSHRDYYPEGDRETIIDR
ncbi:MAG: hypothetical protein ABJN39_06095 [Sulfitobacter sp.]|uniref:hypothetical protein n=1 Tax=Sulfitobacter sp. TaxID=1903071 RepID=UPI003298003C